MWSIDLSMLVNDALGSYLDLTYINDRKFLLQRNHSIL